MNVLIVDDDPAICALLRIILSRDGHHAESVGSVAEAKEFLGTTDVQLVLCDLRMPLENGSVLIPFVRNQHPGTSIVIVSGLDDPVEAQLAEELGASGYLLKPVERDLLRLEVNNALIRHQERVGSSSCHAQSNASRSTVRI